jgi:hypothetical protein
VVFSVLLADVGDEVNEQSRKSFIIINGWIFVKIGANVSKLTYFISFEEF